MNYKISIIIPVFNTGNYIKEALESIITQTIGFKQLEVIMVDDCSTDNSGIIMDEYADKYENFKAVHLPQNSKAAGKPRNVGMEIAISDYLMFLDPDDQYSVDACKLLYDKITTEDADVVFGTFTKLDEISKERKLISPFKLEEGKTEIKEGTIDDEKRFLSFPPALWARIFRRKFIKQNNIVFPEEIPAQDLVFVTHALLKAEGIIYIDKVITHYNNFRQGSITNDTDKNTFIGLLKGYYRTYDICKENGRENDFISFIIRKNLVYWTSKLILSNITDSEKEEVLKFSYKLFKMCQKNHSAVPEHFKPFFASIVHKDFDTALLLLNQLSCFKNTEYLLRKKALQLSRQLKTSQSSVKKVKSEYKDLKSEHEDLKSQFYEFQYKNNFGRPVSQRIISLFPWFYLLLKIRKNSLKSRVLNIKGYYSIKRNNLLDIGFYLKNNRDVRLSGMDPVIHYIVYGYKEGRRLNPHFNGENYFKTHMDITESNLSPLVHYSLYGISQK